MDLTGKHYTWFQNRECEYFPCHKGVREEEFNCLFCYCPLYRQLRAAGRDQGLLLLPAAPQRAGELRLHPSQTDGIPWCLGSGGDPLSQAETLLHAPIERDKTAPRQRPAPPGSRSAYPVPERPARLEPQGEPNRRPAAAGPRPPAAGELAPKNPPAVSPGMGKARRSEHSSGLVCCVSRFQWLGFEKIAKKRASCSLKRTERGTAGKRR